MNNVKDFELHKFSKNQNVQDNLQEMKLKLKELADWLIERGSTEFVMQVGTSEGPVLFSMSKVKDE